MTDTTVAAPTRHTLKTSERTIQDFLDIDDSAYQMGSAARGLLQRLVQNEATFKPRPEEEAFVCLTQDELGFHPGERLRDGHITAYLAAREAPLGSLAFALDLWAAPNGAPVGNIYMDPVMEYRLEVQEEAGVRWLRAVSASLSRQWVPEVPIIHMAP